MNTPLPEGYYEYLQVSPNADQETIERIYRLLAKKFHPDNIPAWVGITYFNNKLGRVEAALAAARKILQLKPTFSAEDFEKVLSLKFRVDGMKNVALLQKAGIY